MINQPPEFYKLILNVVFNVALIVVVFVYFPFPQLLRAYLIERRRKYLAAINERFMREWKAREQSK